MHPAKSARLAKEAHPENWCPVANCLWNTRRSGPCAKHAGAPRTDAERDPDLEALLEKSTERAK